MFAVSKKKLTRPAAQYEIKGVFTPFGDNTLFCCDWCAVIAGTVFRQFTIIKQPTI